MISSCAAVLKLHMKATQFSSKLLANWTIPLFNLKWALSAKQANKFLIFSKARDVEDVVLHVTAPTGHSIEMGSVYKHVGVWLDQKLTFKFHTNTQKLVI